MKKLMKNAYNAYLKSTNKYLSDVYTTYSQAKKHAFDYCVELMSKYNGRDLKIISSNTFMFTAGFEYADPITGELSFCYITPSHDIFSIVEG